MKYRTVSIDARDLEEGVPAQGYVEFTLPCDLHATGDDKIIRAGSIIVPLEDGKGAEALPVYGPDLRQVDGSTDWAIVVKKSWATEPYWVRVPAGVGSISLADLTSIRPLRRREQVYAVTGAAASIKSGTAWAVKTSLTGGVLSFDFTTPAAGHDHDGRYYTKAQVDAYRGADADAVALVVASALADGIEAESANALTAYLAQIGA